MYLSGVQPIHSAMTKTELARTCIEKYIELALKHNKQFSKRHIATVLYNENPDVFKDVEDARSIIRNCLNAHGQKKKYKCAEDLARQFALIPEAIREVETTEPFVVPTGIKKTLWIADIHGRFYNRSALEVAVNTGIKEKCDSVIILGDFLDFYGFSKFDKNPLVSSIFEEQEWGQDILEMLQNIFGTVVLKEGNHDIRRQRYVERLSASMPELVGLCKYSDYLFFNGCHVNFVEDNRHIVYGKLNGIHGHEYYGGGGVHVAYNRLLKTFDNTISAHSHVGQSVIRKDINNNVFGSWSLSCMCDLAPRYSPKNNWTNGFAITSKDSTGDFEVDNKVIHGNKVFAV